MTTTLTTDFHQQLPAQLGTISVSTCPDQNSITLGLLDAATYPGGDAETTLSPAEAMRLAAALIGAANRI